MFCHFWQKFENSKWPPFLGRGNFFRKLPRVHCLDTLWVENFDEIALPRTVKEIEVNLFFFPFLTKIRKFKMAAICGKRKIFLKIAKDISQIPWGPKISTKSLYLTRLRRYKQICVLPFLAKIQNGRHFWGGGNFLKTAKSTWLEYPVGRKFRRNRFISHG